MKKELQLSLCIVMMLLLSPFALKAQTVYMTDGFENGFNPTCDASCKTTAWTQEYYDVSKGSWVTTAPKFSQAWKTEQEQGTDLQYPLHAAKGKGRAYFRNEPDKNGNVQTAGYKTRLVTPVMDLSKGYQPILRFYHAQAKYTGDFDTLRVYYRIGEGLSWNLISEYTSPIKNWKFEEIGLPAVGEYYQIAFEASENIGRGIVLDSVLVRTRPQITTPHDITFLDMRDNGITVQWQASKDADFFQVALFSRADIDLNVMQDSISAALVDTLVTADGDLQVRFSNLEGGNTYYIQIRSIGELENSVWCDVETFRMKLSVQIPFVEDFEGIKEVSNTLGNCQLKTWVWAGDKQPHIPTYLPTTLNELFSPSKTHAVAFVAFGKYNSNTGFPDAVSFIPAGTTALLVSPEIASKKPNFNLNQCHVSFWGTVAQATDAHARSIIVGVMTDPEDLSTFIPVDTCTVWGYKTFQFFDVNFANYQGDGRYVAFLSNFNKTNQFFIDDVTIEERPAVGNVLMSDIKIMPDTASAEITWNPIRGATKYIVKVAKLDGKGVSTPIFADEIEKAFTYTVTSPSLSVTELQPASKYVVAIQTEGGSWSQPRAFFTSAVATVSKTAEAFFAFDKDGNTYNIGEDMATLYPAEFMLFSNDPDIPYIYTTNFRNGTGCLGMTKNVGCDTWIVAPIVDSVDSLEIQFYSKTGDSNAGKIQVGVMTYPDDISTFVPVEEFVQENTYTKRYANFLNYKGSGRYIALRWVEIGDGTTKSCNYIDDMTVRRLGNCLPVTGLTIATTDSSAVVSWNKASASKWQLKVNTSPLSETQIDKTEGNIFNANALTTNTCIIDSLKWAHSYYVYVRAMCGEDSYGDWVGKPFTTDCPEKMPVPYLEDLERYDASSTKLPPCWNVYYTLPTSTTYPKIYKNSTHSNSGDNCIDLYATATYGSYLSLPEVAIPLNDVLLRFYAKGSGGAVLFVGVMDDPDDPFTFSRIDSIPMNTTPTQYSMVLSKYTGKGKYIAFTSWRGTTNQVYLDDIEILSAIDAAPSNIVVKEATSTSMTAVWEGKITDKWEVIVSKKYYALVDKDNKPFSPNDIPEADRVAAGLVPANEFVIESGLEAMTNYYFYIKATKGTEWAVATLMTACKGVNPREKYTEGFENLGKTVTATLSATQNYANYFGNAQVPTCWTVGNAMYGTDMSKATTSTIRNYFPFVASNGTINSSTGAETNYYDKGTAKTTYAYAADGYNYLKLYGSYSSTESKNYAPAWAAMPYLECADEDLSLVIITGKAQMSSSNTFIVGIMEDPEDMSTFVDLDSITGGNGTGNGADKAIAFEVSLENYTGKGHYIAFRTPYGKTSTVYLDEINVSLATCAAPNISFVRVTDTSARLMSGLRIDNAWKYYLSLQPFDTKAMDEGKMPADSVVIEAKTIGDGSILVPYAPLTNLLPDTTYYVAVATICDATTSAWRQASFKTLCPDVDIESFTDNFENYTTGNGSPVGCWVTGNVVANASTAYIPSAFATTFPSHPKTNMLKFQANKTSGNGAYAITSGLATPEGKSIRDYQLEMIMAATGVTGSLKYTASEEGSLIVGIAEDPQDLTTMQVIDTFRFITPALSKLVVPFDSYTGKGKYVVLFAEAFDKTTSWFYVDDVKFSLTPSCKHAQKLQIDTIEQTSVALHWEGSSPKYNVAISTVLYADSVKSDSLIAANSKVILQQVAADSATVTGLKPNTNYYVYVQGICSETDKSVWSYETVMFRTDCPELAAIPWFDDFDDVAYFTGAGNFGYCYQGEYLLKGEKSNVYPQINSGTSYAVSGMQSMKLYGATSPATTVLTTPEFDVNNLNELQLSFYAKGSANKWLYIGTIDSVEAMANTFIPFDSVEITASFVKYTINLDTVKMGARAGKKHIAFYAATTSSTVYIDDLLVRYIPTCYEPEDVTVSEIGLNKATINFVPAKEADNKWIVRLTNLTDTITETVTLTQPTYQFTTLKPNTDYSVAVRNDCGDDQSDWTKEVNFHTKWIVDTYTFTFKKDEQGTISCNTPLSTSSFIHPALISLSGAKNTFAYYPQYTANTENYAYAYDSKGNTTSNALKFQTSATYDSATLVLPIVTNPENKQIRFSLRAGYAYASDNSTAAKRNVVNTVYPRAALMVGTVDSTCAKESFRPFTTITPSKLVKEDTLSATSHYGWDEIIVPLASLPVTEGRQVAFMMAGCKSATIYMGGLAIENAEGYTTPIITAVSPADTAIMVSWVGQSAAEYNIYVIDTLKSKKVGLNYIPYLQEAAEECITKIAGVKGLSYTITGLKESSTYAVYVQDAAHADKQAALSRRVIVTTVCSSLNGNGYAYSFEVGPNYKGGKSPKVSIADGFTFQWPASTTAGDTVYRTPDCWTVGIDYDSYDPINTTYKSYNPTMYPNSASNRYSLTGNSALQFYGSSKYNEVYAVMPSLTFDMDTAELVFYGRCFKEKTAKNGTGTVESVSYIKGGSTTAYSQKMAVGTVLDPADISTFVPLDTVEYGYSAEDLNTSMTVDYDPAGLRYFQKFTVPLQGATGKFIAFRQVGYGYMWIDDVSIQKRQTARIPRELNTLEIGTDSAVITWRPMEDGGTFTLQYMEKKSTKDWTKATTVANIVGNTYTIKGLQDATQYVWRVCQKGSALGDSEYSMSESFQTDCKLYSPNGLTTGFEGSKDDPDYVFYMSGSTEYKSNLCWTYLNQGTSTSMGSNWAYNIPATSTVSYAHSGKAALKLYHYSTTYQTVAVSPELNAEIGEKGKGFDTLQVSFWMCPSPHGVSGTYKDVISTASGKTYAKRVDVGTCTDPNNPETYTVLDSCIYECEGNNLAQKAQADAKNDYAFRKFSVKLDKATGPYVFFRANKNRVLEDGTVCTYSTVYIDDIEFETIQRCDNPSNDKITNITTHDATLSWDKDDFAAFDVEVATESTFDSTTIVFSQYGLTDSVLTITGLKHSMQYYYHIRSYCNVALTEVSDWTQTDNFRTPFAPVFNENFTTDDITSNNKGWKKMMGYAKDVFADASALVVATKTNDYNSWYRLENNVLNGMHLRMAMFYGAAANKPAAAYQKEDYYQKYWLITPLIAIEKENAQLVFDVALSTYEYQTKTLNQPIQVYDGWNTGWDDQFMIIVSDDGGETWKRENAVIWNNETTNDPTDKHYRYGIGDYRLTDIAYAPHKISIDLTKYQGKTIKIAFYCENTEQNANCAIHIDNVHVNYAVKQSKNITSCQFVDVEDELGFSWDGDTISATMHSLERYVLATDEGKMDSVFILNADIKEAPVYTYEITVCEGTPFQYLGFNEHTNPGTYRMKLTSRVTGCDSIVDFTIRHTPKFETVIDTTICEGGFVDFDGKRISDVGIYTANLKACEALGGCDSIVTLRLSMTSLKRSHTTAVICEGETYTFGGKVYTASGIYYDTIPTASCDSIATLSLTIRANKHSVFNAEILQGQAYQWAGKSLTGNVTMDSIFTDVNGCDSIVTLNLSVKYPNVNYSYVDICQGSTYQFGGKTYNATGTYFDTISTVGAPDVINGLVLAVHAKDVTSIMATICAGDSLVFNNQILKESGIYQTTYENRFGCDSIVNLTLSALETSHRQDVRQICEGSYFDLNGKKLTETGTYYDTLHYVSGCDSIITEISLNVIPTIYTERNATICAGSEYLFEDTVLTTTGNYKRTIINANTGCDEIITLHLNVNEPLRGTKYASFSKGCTYTYNGVTYDQAGKYEVGTLKTEAGCDSIITLILSEADQGRDTVWASVCSGQYYIDEDFNTNVIGTHEVEIQQEGGCSIIRTLILTSKDNSIAQQASICPGDTYEFYGQTLTEAGSYTETLKGQGEDCDTIVTLTLAVLSGDTLHVTDEITTDQLPYMYNGEVVLPLDTKEGVYTDTLDVKSETGKCSQTVILTVTVRQPDAVDNIGYNSLQIRPNAISRGETVYIEHDFSASERAEMTIEMFDMLGHRMEVRIPETGAITISDFPSAGVYTVRISTDEQTYIGRIVVKN